MSQVLPRVALAVALFACILAGWALVRTPPPSPFGLVCGQSFHDAQTGTTVPMYVPCSEHRP